jgi:hypothetical protein
MVPVSAMATAQPVMTPSRRSRSWCDSGGSSATRSTGASASQASGSPAGATIRLAPRASSTVAMAAGNPVAVVRWTVAR